jgi:glycosyltransferase involved in cell wall biosynthesis
MKILHVYHLFAPCVSIGGGVVKVADDLSATQAAKGHQVTIITTDGCKRRMDVPIGVPVVRRGVTVLYFHNVSNRLVAGMNISTPLGMAASMKRLVRAADIVHIHEHRTYPSILARRYARKYGKPHLVQPHGSTPQHIGQTSFKKLFDLLFGYRILRDAARVIAVSEEEAGFDRSLGVKAERIRVVYNGMDASLQREEDPLVRQGWGAKAKVVLYLGRISDTKGLDFLLRGFKELTKLRDDVTLVVAGPDNGYLGPMNKLIQTLGLENDVRYIGEVKEEDKAKVLSSADLFVHVVRYMGGVGIAPLEALLCEVPVVVTDECGEVIRKADIGHIVGYDDAAALSSRLNAVLDHPEEERERARRGRRYILEHLSWDKVSEEVEDIYEDCLRNP